MNQIIAPFKARLFELSTYVVGVRARDLSAEASASWMMHIITEMLNNNGKDNGLTITSTGYLIKETSSNVTIHSPLESCTFSLGDRANSYRQQSNVRRMAGKASIGPITCVSAFEKKSKKFTAIVFFAFRCSLLNSFIYSHQSAQFASD